MLAPLFYQVVFIFLGFLIAVFSITSEHFLSPYNITSLLTNISYSGIAAIVLTLIIISRGLDISIGGVIGLTTVVVATLYSQNDPLPTWLILIIGLSTGAIVGLVNGWCITALDMDPIITTLGAMAITRGLAYVISDSQSILMFEDTTDYISNGTILYIPIPIIIFILTVIIFSVLLHKSKFGRAVYAIGANELSAEFSGIAIKSKKMILYILSGVAASISGIILLGQTSVGMPQHGLGTELAVENEEINLDYQTLAYGIQVRFSPGSYNTNDQFAIELSSDAVDRPAGLRVAQMIRS